MLGRVLVTLSQILTLNVQKRQYVGGEIGETVSDFDFGHIGEEICWGKIWGNCLRF